MNIIQRSVAICVILTLLGLFARAGSSKTVDEVLQFTVEKSKAYKDWTADVVQTISMGAGEMQQRGTMAFKIPSRMRMLLTMEMMGQSMTNLIVYGADGVMWTEINAMGQRQVMKIDAEGMKAAMARAGADSQNPLDAGDPTKQLDAMKQMFDFSMGADEELEGQPMYVLLGKAKNAPAATKVAFPQGGAARILIGQKDGFIHKIEMLDEAKKPVMVHEFRKLKFDTNVPDTEFQYTPPDGVQVMDMSKMLAPDAAPKAPASETPPAGAK